MSQNDNVEKLFEQLGATGKYQTKQHILHFFVAVLSGMNMFSLTFIAPTPSHRCFIPGVDVEPQNNTTSDSIVKMPALFEKEILSQYIPLNSDGTLESCLRYSRTHFDNHQNLESSSSMNYTQNTLLLELEPCNGHFVYDTSIYHQSRVYDWDMVCENKWKRAMIQSIYVLGVFSGALFCGALADRYGRKMVLCISGLLQFVFAISQPYFTNFAVYTISLFFYGMFASAGAYVTAFVMTMELVHKRNRAYCGAIFNSSFAVGACMVPIYGYLIRNITTLQTVYGMHALVLLGYWWQVDESIRWLWSQGRVDEAVRIVRNAVNLNGGSFTNNYYQITQNLNDTKPQQSNNSFAFGLLDLFGYPIMRYRLAITAFNWFAISLCFYGLAFNTQSLPGDPYFVFFICAFADLPGFLLVALFVNKTGRRTLNSTLLFVGGLTCIITTIIPRGWLVTVLSMIAKVMLACCFAIVYNYTAELFPTVVRNSALGLCTMSSRLAGTLTPWITLLNSIDKSFPVLVFGGVALFAAFAFLSLPETLSKELPQTLEDGEVYGRGDTAFNFCSKDKENSQKPKTAESHSEKMLA